MNFLCPSCRTPLPRAVIEQVTCTACGVQVDLTRAETAPGQARLWPEVDLSGESLGGYVLDKLLGSGGMGTVYEARAADGSKVALKVLAPLLAAEPELRERFRREARALAAIKHPGVVRMLADGEERSFCWYAMELVPGADLRTRLKSGALPASEVRALAQALLEALAAVHAAGFVHRDVKPANVLLAADGPRLCDFGIARVEDASTLTASAAVMGSLRYMSPEQRWGRSDLRSDLYGLGVVLHEALALGVPGERRLPGSTPRELVKLIDALTQNDPDRRPQSAPEALGLLRDGSRRPLLRGALGAVGLGVALALVGFAALVALDSAQGLEEGTTNDGGSTLTTNVAPGSPLIDASPDAGERDGGERDAGAMPDAGSPPDAGTPPDAGPAAGGDTPSPLLSTGPKSPGLRPTKVRGLGTKGGTGLLLDSSALELAPGKPTKPVAEPTPTGPAQISVVGTGPGKVYARGVLLGDAPGTFDVEPGAFLLEVRCDRVDPRASGKKKKEPDPPTFRFKGSATRGAAPRVFRYACPG